jgi:predicted DCC family thiol-disulfide oxidoreductase YuxK
MTGGRRSWDHALIYDGECGICRRSMDWVRSRDARGRVRIVPYQDPSVPAEFPAVPREEMENALQLISDSGERWQGADAVAHLLALLPGCGLVGSVLRAPLLRPLSHRVYRLVARNRRKLGCGDHCNIPGS